jgi:hypothetical protein
MLNRNVFCARGNAAHILWNVLVSERYQGYHCGLLNIAIHSSVLSCNEQHKHLHFNVHYGSQLKISRVCLKTISFLHYSLFGNTSVTVVVTLKGLRTDNHSDLITENAKLLTATQHVTEEDQETSDTGIFCIHSSGGTTQGLCLYLFIYLFSKDLPFTWQSNQTLPRGSLLAWSSKS